ncbi:MAG TPA: TonB-dependent receptor [Dinghuibacter sp.]|uniref:TonB-dependent receptor domain-containing protein n=1 Tax=Dinghuibacter sp. TaxID=2024697 RepID=UPI002CA41B20|nr:TonB-dependent receptor [Dinghuibacter sp.]HTJ12246.1 TonB-dependent receptor [Dinghuibacter sp.]
MTVLTHAGLCLLTLLCLSARAQDTLRHGKTDTLKSIRILGQRPLAEKRLDRTVVHVDALMANTGGQALDALANTPGVTVDDDGTITLNGKDGILILIDDRPTYLDGQALVNYLKSLPASTLSSIELLPNPPARYPASGNGIIILRTKKALSSGFHAQVTSNYQWNGYPHTSQSIDVNGQEGAWQFSGMAAYSYNRNWFESDRWRRYTDATGKITALDTQINHEDNWAQSIDYMAAVDHKGARTSWGALVSGSANPYHEIGHYRDGFYNALGLPDSMMDTRSRFHNYAADVNANGHFSHRWAHEGRSLSADADFVHYRTEGHQDEVSTSSDVYELISDQPFIARIYSFKADYTDKFGKTFFLEAGAQETYSVRQSQGAYLDGAPGLTAPDSAQDNTFRYEEQIRSAYATLRHESKRFTLQAGLRLEDTWAHGRSSGNVDSTIRLSYVDLFPSVHALYKASDADQFTFAYSRRIERPDYNDLNPSRFYFDRTTYFNGNTALQPEFSQNAEVAYTYKGRYTLTASYSSERGLIHQFYVVSGNTFYYYQINMDHRTSGHLAADASTPLGPHWSLNAHGELAVSHYKTHLPDSTMLDKTMPYCLFSGNLRYNFLKGWSAEAVGQYQSSVLVGQTVIQPGGHLNLTVRKKVLHDAGAVTIQGIDVPGTWINRRYAYMNGATEHFYNDFHHRAVSLTFTYGFGKKGIKVERHESGAEEERARL